MLTEDDLREVVEQAAAAAPRPTSVDIRRYADGVAPARRRRVRWPSRSTVVGVGVAAAVLAVLSMAFTGNLGGSSSDAKFNTVGKAAGPASQDQSFASSSGADTSFAPRAVTPQAGSATAGGTPAAAPGGSAAPEAVTPAAPVDSAKVVKNGSVELGVEKGAVPEAITRITGMATGLGGYVADTRTSGGTDGVQASGTVTVRVPAATFEQLLGDVGKLGDVRSTTSSGVDVTAQYTDLDAKIGALQATHDQLLTILTQAQSIPDILAVQDRINQVQGEMDSLKGQRQLLADQATYGTLAVTVLEPGATAAPLSNEHDEGLGDAWDDAKGRFGDAIEWLVRISGTLVVLVGLALIAVFVTWLVTRRTRRRFI
jgi:hypothetical protein